MKNLPARIQPDLSDLDWEDNVGRPERFVSVPIDTYEDLVHRAEQPVLIVGLVWFMGGYLSCAAFWAVWSHW